MATLSLLRRLAEQHDYWTLQESCLYTPAEDAAVQVLRALAAIHLGDASAGRRILETIDRDALDLDARVDLAAVQIALDEADQAVAILEAARRERADHPLLLARLAWCRLQQGRLEEATSLYEQSLALKPFLAVYHSLTSLYRDQGRLDDAVRCLEAAWPFWEQQRTEWPENQRAAHDRQLRGMQLALWLARDQLEAAEAWLQQQREALDETQWCDLVAGLAENLAARDRHTAAEDWLRTGLRRYPEHLKLYLRLAELAELQGRPYQAIALLRRAITLAETQHTATPPLWSRLSAVALPFDPGLARRAAEQARDQLVCLTGADSRNVAETADYATQVELALAAVEAQEHDYTSAERRYRGVLAQRPHMIAALQGLGQLLMQCGRIDEAVELFERVKAIDPTRGYGGLISARRFPEDEHTLQHLEVLARRPTLEGSVRTSLLFQLAAAWEKRGDFDKAFTLADEANAASRRLLRYDPKAHRQRCARIRHAFPKGLYEHRPGTGHESALPIFVVGMPRSGTTLVEQIIAGHSRIHGAGELGTIPRVIAGLERWERHTGSGRHFPDCVDDLDPAVVRGIAESVLQELRDYAPGADHVVDKLPPNFENIGLIKLLFPRARIISVRRDPRDVALSNYFTDFAAKHGGMGFAYDLKWIGEQLADHNLLMQHWHQVFPGEILEVSYEAVLEDPEGTARTLLHYIGVDWEPQVLEFHALQRPVRTASVWQVRQPLYHDSKAKWQNYRQYLGPLIAGSNRKIRWEPIEMVTLPEPGWLNLGVDRYRQGDLDGAEFRFKQLLQYLPQHAAARFMLGLVYVGKGYRPDGIALMEQALQRCPWNRNWRRDLARAYRLEGRDQEATALASAAPLANATARAAAPQAQQDEHLFLSGESACTTFHSATSGAGR